MVDVFPNYLLSAFSVRRSWAEKNRPLVVRFLKAVIRAKKWFEQDRKAAIEFLGERISLTPALAEKGLDYYLATPAWHPGTGNRNGRAQNRRRHLCRAE